MHSDTNAALVAGAGKGRGVPAHYSMVAIGGSAGGLESVSTILNGLPANFVSPILVVIHLHPDYNSHVAEILRRKTKLKVKDAQEREVIKTGVVYLAPRNHHLLIRDGLVELTSTAAVNYSRPSIDTMFASVVKAYGAGVIGVILSGTGKDGAEGLRAIKEAGGFAIVEDPLTAKFSAMPAAAVLASAAARVVSLKEIAPLLLKVSGTVEEPPVNE